MDTNTITRTQNTEAKTTGKGKTYDMAYIAVFTVLMAVCSLISIPTVVPFTLQTFAVFLAVLLLGGKRGLIAVLTYILLGAVGMPVFSGFRGGIGMLLGSTGGYIVGFILVALIMWGAERLFGKKLWVQAVSMILGLAACYALGTAWFLLVYMNTKGPVSLMTVLGWCVIPFIIPDLIKIALALTLGNALRRPLAKIMQENI